MKRSALFLAVALVVAVPARAQTTASVNALETWIKAVNAHQPGKVDPAVGFVGALKYSDRAILNPAMTIFLAALRRSPVAAKSDSAQKILELYHAVRANPGPAPFLYRAAVLHADAAIFRDKFPDFEDDAPTPGAAKMSIDPMGGAPSGRRSVEASPLLSNERAMVHTDGRVVGQAALNWNWPFARALLDLLLRAPAQAEAKLGACRGAECMGTLSRPSDIGTEADRVFIAEWYHATDAYLLATGKHADLNRHLTHAAAVLFDDPHILFDRACYAETLGLPLYQVLPGDAGYWNAPAHIFLDVPSEDKTDREAEKLFAQAIAVDPKYAEARVRLARLLERRGLHDEAASQIEQALAATPAGAVAYFAHIVAGRVELARGHAADALGHYRAALAIFPDAQSALLGASQAAVMSSDVPGALALAQKLGDRTAKYDADPWWNYNLGAGRDVDDLMAALWSRVTAKPR